MSVLFVDLVGFTSFSEGRDPEDVRSLITDYFDVARNVIERFGGTVDKFIGDAVMAWWGATTSQEDDAERAVRAALEVVDAVSSLGEQSSIPDLAARAGVMTGEVAVGPGGNEMGLLLGDLVNSTARLQSIAQRGSVLVGETTRDLVATAIELESAGTHVVKGKEEPIHAWRALRVLSERRGRGRADQLEPPFVGRVSELRLLKDTLHATERDQRSRLVSLVGQAGIGKSRLIWEFLKYVDGLVEDVYWHEGRSPSYGDGLSLWALGEMIRGRAGIQETDADDVTAERLAEAVRRYVPGDEVQWVGDRLAALLGLGDSVGRDRTELYAAVRAFFEGIARKGTTVLVFEDLHWADPSLLEFIEELPDWSQDHPIMIVTMARPDLLDRRPDWGSGRAGFASMYLGPLSESEMAQLIGGAVEGVPATAIDRIAAAAGGVPLFAVEMLRMLLGDGRLVVEDGGVAVVGDLAELDVPSSVQAVISARLDRLPDGDRELARDAAVLGHSFTIEGLAALTEESLDKMERRLGDLVRREILTLVRDPRSPERGQYQWVQSVLREVAYGRISRTDRRDLHLRVARYFRDLSDPELAPVAASHFVSAAEQVEGDDRELRDEMVEALHAAIARARALHAHEQVLALVDTALPVVPEAMTPELYEAGALAAVRLSDDARADMHTQALSDLASASDDLRLQHRAVALAGKVANETRRAAVARDLLEGHIERHPDLDSDLYLASAAVELARVYLLMGDDTGAARLADDALAAVEKLDLPGLIADAMITRGTALAATRPHQCMALLQGALELSRHNDLMDTKLRALINIGYSAQDLDVTLAASEEAYDEATRIGDRSHASFVASNLVGIKSFLLDLDGVERLLNDPAWSSSPSDLAQREASLADLALRRGNRSEADLHLERAKAHIADVADLQSTLWVERTESGFMMADRNNRPAFDVARRHFKETPFAPGLAVSTAVTAAAMEADPEMLREARSMAAELPPGIFNTPPTRWIDVMLTTLEEDADAGVSAADALREDFERDRLVWFEVMMLVSMMKALPRDHEARDRYLARVDEITVPSGALGVQSWAHAVWGTA